MDIGVSSQTMLNTTEVDCMGVLADKPWPTTPVSGVPRYLLWLVLVLLPLLTLFGNGIVILSVVKFRFLRTRANAFIVSLAIADIGVATLTMPFRAYEAGNNYTWPLGDVFCDVVNMFDVVLSTASILNLSCLAFDRYLAICRPFRHEVIRHRTAVLMILSCWLIPLIAFVIPMMHRVHIIGIEDYVTCVLEEMEVCQLVMNIPFSLFSTPISFYIPSMFMLFCYWRIFLAARKHARVMRSFSCRDSEDKEEGRFRQETKAAKTLGIVMGCFCVCWFPFIVVSVADPLAGYRIPALVKVIAEWLGYINSMMNPALYYVFSRQFKTAYRQLFRRARCTRKPPTTIVLQKSLHTSSTLA